MTDLTRSLAFSAAAMQAQANRLRHVAENIANADTPGYRARDLRDFASLHDASPPFDLRASRPGHLVPGESRAFPSLLSGGAMAPNGNDVSLDLQMMKMVQARQAHDLALAVYRTTSSITRTALGRAN